MEFNDAGVLAFAWWASNIIGLLFVVVALKHTRGARLMFAILFGYAAWVNFDLSHTDPQVYLDYAATAVGFYSSFILGWFSGHITAFVSAIAAGQLLIAVGMLLRKSFVTAACAGVIIFLAAIAPLGVYAAFPFSLTVSVAAYLVIRSDDKEYLWKRNRVHHVFRKKEVTT